MKIFSQVIGLETGDASPSILLSTDSGKYIFNVGEGLQRFCTEHRVRLVKVDGLFLTRVSVETLGGLPGMSLTLADMGKKSLKIHGGPGLSDYLFALRHFMRRDDVSVELLEMPAGADLTPMSLPEVIISPVMLVAEDSLSATRRHIDTILSSAPASAPPFSTTGLIALDSRVETGSGIGGHRGGQGPFNPLNIVMWPSIQHVDAGCGGVGAMTSPSVPFFGSGSCVSMSRGMDATRASVCYAIETQPIAGRFHPARAARLGVPPGPLCGRLSKGESVEVLVHPRIAMELGTRGVTHAHVAATDAAMAVAASAAAAAGSGEAPVKSKGKKPVVGIPGGVSVTITPSHVKDPDVPGQVLMIVDVPSLHFLSAFTAATTLTAASHSPNLCVVYHFSPCDVVSHPAYQAWMDACPPSAQHVLCHSSTLHTMLPTRTPTPLESATPSPHEWAPFWSLTRQVPPVMFRAQAFQLCKMHVLEPRAFPLPYPLNVAMAAYEARARCGRWTEDHALSPLQRIVRHYLLANASVRASTGASAQTASHHGDGSAGGDGVDDSLLRALPPATSAIPAHDAYCSVLHAARSQIVAGVPMLIHHMVPLALAASGPDWSQVPQALTPWEAVHDMLVDAPMEEALQLRLTDTRVLTTSGSGSGYTSPAERMLRGTSALVAPDFEVTFTGTSSAIPSKYRNVSGIILQVPSRTSTPTSSCDSAAPCGTHRPARPCMLLDGGEGTYGQLCRRFASEHSLEGAHSRLESLRLIWISHMHADHHLGIMKLLKRRHDWVAASGRAHTPLLVIGPTRLYFWLLESSRIDPELLSQWQFVDAEHFVQIPTCTPSNSETAGSSSGISDGSHGFAARADVSGVYPLLISKRARTPKDGVAKDSEPDATNGSEAKRARVAYDDIPEPSPLVGGVGLQLTPVAVVSATPACIDKCEPHAGAMHFVELPADAAAAGMYHLATPAFIGETFTHMGILSLEVCRVQHCYKSYAIHVRFQHRQEGDAGNDGVGEGSDAPIPPLATPWSLTYSGDTRPCEEVVSLALGQTTPSLPSAALAAALGVEYVGQQPVAAEHAGAAVCSILIHEATFEDSEEGRINAALKKHSTVEEACAVGEAISATHTLLTHFSARYPKLPVLKSGAAAHTVFVAYDLMSVSGTTISTLPRLLDVLHIMYAEEGEGEGDMSEEGAGDGTAAPTYTM